MRLDSIEEVGIRETSRKDGQRFLTRVVTEPAPVPPVHVLLSRTAQLKK